jgi:hypothetical protein
MMASKVWDDFTMWNSDFSHVCPSFNLARVNALECAVLETVRYDVRVSASCYAKYYFHIRSMMAMLGYHANEIDSVRQLDVEKAKQMKLSTESYIDKASSHEMRQGRSRGLSYPDLHSLSIGSTAKIDHDAISPHKHPAVVLEQIMHEGHSDADGDMHVSHLHPRLSGRNNRLNISRLSFPDDRKTSEGEFDYRSSWRDQK